MPPLPLVCRFPVSYAQDQLDIPAADEGEGILMPPSNEAGDNTNSTSTTSALNTAIAEAAEDRLYEEELAAILGVQAEVFSGLDDIFERLEKAASSDDDESFLAIAEELTNELPELVTVEDLTPLIEAAEALYGAAVIQGIRNALTEN